MSLGLLSSGANSLGVLGCGADKRPCENPQRITVYCLLFTDSNSVVMTGEVDKLLFNEKKKECEHDKTNR